MGLCRAAQVLVVSGGMQLSCSRLTTPLHCRASVHQPSLSILSSSSSHCLRVSMQRPLLRRFAPRLGDRRGRRIFFTLKESNKEVEEEQQQPSIVAGDSKSEGSTMVEHVVFFKGKDEQRMDEFVTELRTLKSLDGISDLSANKVLQILGGDYTHVLHSRHVNKASLDAYTVHPSHVGIVKKFFRDIEDRLAVDWEAESLGSQIEGGHGAARIALMKVADGLTEEEHSMVFDLLHGLRDKFPFIRQISAGMNFSPARAKGFNLGFVALFDNMEELEQLNGNAELHSELRRSRVAPFLTNFLIADIDSKKF